MFWLIKTLGKVSSIMRWKLSLRLLAVAVPVAVLTSACARSPGLVDRGDDHHNRGNDPDDC